MKIYEYIKDKKGRTAKLFGFPIMQLTSDYMTAERHQSFLGGMITTLKTNDIYAVTSKKDIKISGYSIAKRIEEKNRREYYFLNKKYKSVSLKDEFKKLYFRYFDKKHDDIYILRANSGEVYLTLTYLFKTLLKKNNSKNPLIVATQKYHIDLIKMICPDIPYVFIDKPRLQFYEDSFQIENFRFFFLFSNVHFKQVEMDIKGDNTGEYHYFKSIMKRLNISEDEIEMSKATVLPDAEARMQKKAKQNGLNIDNFVFLAPEAKSCELYDEDFWVKLINKFQEKGYDIYVNIIDNDVNLDKATGYKNYPLTYAEAFALAKRAKKIISLRSGFTEFLLQTGVPIDVLYTKFRYRHFFDDMDIYHVMSGFGLSKIPYLDKAKIREFNTVEISKDICIERITDI